MRSASNYSFAVAPTVKMPRSAFKRDRTYKTAFDSGYLVPCFFDEVYPGDTYNVNMQAFARLSTPVVPFMDNVYMDFHFFYVPYRLLWDHWVNMHGEQKNPSDSIDYLAPVLSGADGASCPAFEVGSLFDYFGFPVGKPGLVVNSFLPRAYNKIYNDHFRDENLIDSVPEITGDGPDDVANFKLLKRGKRHDYFTSCLPWPQKGPGATVPIGGNAPVYGDGTTMVMTDGSRLLTTSSNTATFTLGGGASGWNVGDPRTTAASFTGNIGLATKDQIYGRSEEPSTAGLYADLSQATAVTINQLREAFQLQKLWETCARSGTRYAELCRGFFGVINPDARLQRSEFLGGGSIPIQIHSVAQTSSTDSTTPQGNLAAYGVCSGRVGFSKSFVEHGVVIGLVSVRCDLNYQQGLDRSWTRRSRFDYYYPTLAHLGEQAVLNQEIYAQGTPADKQVFGYQERWAELRYGNSKITGKLRSGISGSLDVWHLAQNFTSLPTLSKTFIEENPPLDRVLAVQDEPQIIFDSLSTVNCVRVLPTYSIPGLVDHF